MKPGTRGSETLRPTRKISSESRSLDEGLKAVPMPKLLAGSVLFLLLFPLLAGGQEPSQEPLVVSLEMHPAYPIKKVAPVYPPLARQARIQGTVIVRVVISVSGDIASVQLISGHAMLAPAAMEAVKKWKYQPYMFDGRAVEVETKIQVNFMLRE